VGQTRSILGCVPTQLYKQPLACHKSPTTPFPIVLASGNKLLREIDLSATGTGNAALRFERYFNGTLGRVGGPLMSAKWTHSFSHWLLQHDASTIYAFRPNGQMYVATSPGAATAPGMQRWTTDSDVVEQIYQVYSPALQATGWLVVSSDGGVESYDTSGNLLSIDDQHGNALAMSYSSGTNSYLLDAYWNTTPSLLPAGLLVQVTDNFGRILTLGYNASTQLVQATDPSGLNYRYTYDGSGNLSSVIYPDGKTRQYLYNESTYTGGASLPNSLTGIVDENGTRFASNWYNSSGQAIQETHWADSAQTKAVDQYMVTLNQNGTTTMTDPLNSQATFGFKTINGVYFATSQSQPAGAGCGPASAGASYDANGNATSRQDFNGNITSYSYDTTRNLETQRTEAYGTAQARTISTQWHPTFRVKAAEATPLKITDWIYDGQPDPTNSNATASCAPTLMAVEARGALLHFDSSWTIANALGALLHFDGSAGSTTFTDALGHAFFSSNGAALSTSIFKLGTASLDLNGSNQSISSPSSTDFDLQSDFTIEAFVYYNTVSTSVAQALVSRDNGGGSQNKWGFGLNVLSAGNFSLHRNTTSGTQYNLNWAWSPSANTWYHVAVVRQSNNWTLYINGTSIGTNIDSNPMPLTTAPLVVGALGEGLWYTNGYIDELRITSGVAVYASNFTPPTAPENPVTVQIPNFVDVLGHTFTSNNGATISTTVYRLGTGSLELNGTNQSISTLSNTDLDLQNDFTIEAFVYYNTVSTSVAQALVSRDNGGGSQDKWGFGLNVLSAGDFSLHRNTTSGTQYNLNWNWSPTANTWYHLAIVRQGNNWTIYVNGNSIGTQSDPNPMPLTSAPLVVGALGEGAWYTNGYIDEFRITSGAALYTSNFTPPSAPEGPVTLQEPNLLANEVPPAVLCKQVEQGTTDTTGAAGFGATATGSARVWSYTYNAYGQMLTAKSPRTDLNSTTTYQYYEATDTANTPPHYQIGDRQSVTDALGHVTQFTKYDGNGRLLEQVDPNGLTTDYAYFPRGWLQTVTVTPAASGATLVTSYVYDGVGQLQQTTLPDGTYVKYSYDAAHRLTTITDSAGDTVNYTLDAIGNRQAEKWDDPSGVLRRNISRSYDALNRLQTVTGATQ